MLDTSIYVHNKAFDPVFLRLKYIQWLRYKNIYSWQQTFVVPRESNEAWIAISLEHRQNLAHRYNLILSLGDQTGEGLSWGDCVVNQPSRVGGNPWFRLVQLIAVQQELLQWFPPMYRFLWILLQLRNKSTCQLGQMNSESPLFSNYFGLLF